MNNEVEIIKDRYFVEMLDLVEYELKSENIYDNFSYDAVIYLANCNFLISDMYEVIENIKKNISNGIYKIISINDIKEIINDYESKK